MKQPKTRILNSELAGLLGGLRHGDLVYIGDAGNGTNENWLYPLDPKVRVMDLSICTNVPRFKDVVRGLCETGEYESVIVGDQMRYVNPEDFQVLVDIFGEDHIYEINVAPDMYEIRDKCSAVLQTGDYGKLAMCILVVGFGDVDLPFEIVSRQKKWVSTPMKDQADTDNPDVFTL